MDFSVCEFKFVLLFPNNYPRTKNKRSQLAKCDIIEKKIFVNQDRDDYLSINVFYQRYDIS